MNRDGGTSSAHHPAERPVRSYRYVHADGYSEAIPIDELVGIAKSVAEECGSNSEREVRDCAERTVRSRLCPCAASVDALVDAVVTEFRRQITQARRS